MKFPLILSLVLCSLYSINCLDATLFAVAKDDKFDYENNEVNQVFQVKLHLPVPPTNHFTISKSITFKNWSKNANIIKNIIQKRDEYNRLIENFYTSNNLNNFNASRLLKTKNDILAFRDYFNSWYTKIGFTEKLEWQAVQEVFKFTNKMLSGLILLKRDQINEKIVDEKAILYLSMALEEQLKKNNTGSLVFRTHKHYHYYSERIAKFDKIDVNSRNNTFSLFVPVSGYPGTDEKLAQISVDNLSTFYKENNLKYVKN